MHRISHTYGAIKLFRINTCRSVSRQKTLTSFRINTYEKSRGAATLNSGNPTQSVSRRPPYSEAARNIETRRVPLRGPTTPKPPGPAWSGELTAHAIQNKFSIRSGK